MKSKHFPDSFYRVSVKGICIKDGKILLVKEADTLSGKWELPGGGLDFGEEIRAGLEREIEEETHLNVVSVSKQPIYVWTNHFENRRDIDWFYSVVLAHQIELSDFKFKPTEECVGIGFFTKEELQTLDMHHQSKPLRELFNPADFTKS